MVDDRTQCPIEGCTREHPRKHLMCNPHWRMVPKELQGLVYKTARKMWAGEGSEEWEEARARAIAAVEEKEAERGSTSAPLKSEEPNSVLTALGEKFSEFMEGQGCRGFLLISKDDEGGVTQTGYGEDEQARALSELADHVTALFTAAGVEINFIWPENN